MGFLSAMINRAVFKEVERAIAAEITKAIDAVLPAKIEDAVIRAIRKSYRETPADQQLTELGFKMFMALRIREHWPDVTEAQMRLIVHDAMEGIGAKHGDPAYVWTAGAARETADIYVQEANG